MKRLLTVTFLFVIHISFSQKSPWTLEGVNDIANRASEPELVNTCSMLTQEGYLQYAEILVDKLMEKKPTNANYNYRKGFFCLENRRDYKDAQKYLEVAVTKISSNYDMYSPKEQGAPSDAYYHLAACYHYDNNFVAAKENYQKFLDNTRKKSELIEVAQLKLQQITVAEQLFLSPVNCTIKNLGDKINSKYPDYSSVVSFDGTSIYFTSRRPWEKGESDKYIDPKISQYKEDVYVSYLELDSTWTTPERLDFCTPIRNEASVSVSTDERRIYLYEDSTGNGDIYFSDLKLNKFEEIQLLKDKNINTESWETHITVSPDGQLMIFASDRSGGLGGLDLYYCKRNADGSWAAPVNMGPNINGPKDDDAPFISVNNKQLYFGTNDARSMGGFDILISELQPDGAWGVARNIGYPFNTTNDDLFYTTTVDGLTGYITSYRADGKGEKDIYEIRNDFLGVKGHTVLKGEVVTADGSLLPENLVFMADVTCLDCEDGAMKHVLYTRKRDGRFMTGFQPCKTYTLTYYDATDNKEMGKETFKTECTTEYREIYKVLRIDVEKREVIFPDTIPDVVVKDYTNLELKYYFDYNKNKLTVKRGELKDFVQAIDTQLADGREKVTIVIESSASFVPTKTFDSNEELAKLRAENMKYDLLNYFDSNETTKGKVNVVISKAIVQGPEYVKDRNNTEKYKPYQYVFLKTE